MILLLLMSLAGASGAVCRLLVDGAVRAHGGRRFPYGTLTVNIAGSLLLGVLTGFVLFHGAPTTLLAVLGTGFCGAFTTFGAACFETVRLAQERRPLAALLNSAGNLVLTLLAAGLGLLLTHAGT